mmetsp:Transcript_31089/g.65593  ORF Transcript_31089/g.65593 Transcript_31089/m.65593 type:complete len:107 (+) Transcript_31089:701-1021(+)
MSAPTGQAPMIASTMNWTSEVNFARGFDGNKLGTPVKEIVGGEVVGEDIGDAVGDVVGEDMGDPVGGIVGDPMGESVGDLFGEVVGEVVGGIASGMIEYKIWPFQL